MGSADADVVQAAVDAQRDGAVGVDGRAGRHPLGEAGGVTDFKPNVRSVRILYLVLVKCPNTSNMEP